MEEIVREAVAETGIDATIQMVTNVMEIAKQTGGIWQTCCRN